MPRFFDPERYNEDWYIELKGEYQKLFDYIIEMCDNAGVWKPNKFDFEIKTGFKVNLDSLIEKVNGDKERISVLENGRWFIPGFIKFQWFNRISSFNLSTANPRHINIIRSLEDNRIPLSKVRGLAEVCQRSKDKDTVLTVLKSEEFSIEHCLTVAMKDERWVKANKATAVGLQDFNSMLEKTGVYKKNPMDYKSHFSRWRNKTGDGPTKTMVI